MRSLLCLVRLRYRQPLLLRLHKTLVHMTALLLLGCVIRGETTHYETVCTQSSRGLMDLAVQRHLAIGNGILTVENSEQAWERADINRKDKGGDAARAAMAMSAHVRRWYSEGRKNQFATQNPIANICQRKAVKNLPRYGPWLFASGLLRVLPSVQLGYSAGTSLSLFLRLFLLFWIIMLRYCPSITGEENG